MDHRSAGIEALPARPPLPGLAGSRYSCCPHPPFFLCGPGISRLISPLLIFTLPAIADDHRNPLCALAVLHIIGARALLLLRKPGTARRTGGAGFTVGNFAVRLRLLLAPFIFRGADAVRRERPICPLGSRHSSRGRRGPGVQRFPRLVEAAFPPSRRSAPVFSAGSQSALPLGV